MSRPEGVALMRGLSGLACAGQEALARSEINEFQSVLVK
jgi:hypothetical protein